MILVMLLICIVCLLIWVNVTDMSSMFYYTGYKSPVFTLDLGDKFDTSNVTQVTANEIILHDNAALHCTRGMFENIGYSNPTFTLNLGDKFYTSNITNMSHMFYETGNSNNNFTLDVSTFDFSNVTEYSNLFGRWKTTQKIYVKDSTDQAWVIARDSSVFSTSNVLIK